MHCELIVNLTVVERSVTQLKRKLLVSLSSRLGHVNYFSQPRV